MKITKCEKEFLVSLNADEASRLMDACAMVVLAADSVPGAELPTPMASVLGHLFEGLRSTAGCELSLEHPDA